MREKVLSSLKPIGNDVGSFVTSDGELLSVSVIAKNVTRVRLELGAKTKVRKLTQSTLITLLTTYVFVFPSVAAHLVHCRRTRRHAARRSRSLVARRHGVWRDSRTARRGRQRALILAERWCERVELRRRLAHSVAALVRWPRSSICERLAATCLCTRP